MDRTPNAICKVCGKAYHHCKDCDRIPGQWRMVACSPECWIKWVEIIESRSPNQKQDIEDNQPTEQKIQIKSKQKIKREAEE